MGPWGRTGRLRDAQPIAAVHLKTLLARVPPPVLDRCLGAHGAFQFPKVDGTTRHRPGSERHVTRVGSFGVGLPKPMREDEFTEHFAGFGLRQKRAAKQKRTGK